MTLENTIFVFIPDSLEKNNVGFLSGFVVNKPHQSEFYIIKDKLSVEPKNCIGYCGKSSNVSKLNWISLNYSNNILKVNEITCINNHNYRLICVIYNYFLFCNSEIIQLTSQRFGEHFTKLTKALNPNAEIQNRKTSVAKSRFAVANVFLGLLNLFVYLAQFSSILSVTCNSFWTLHWAVRSIVKERKINLKVGNCIVAKIVDVCFGLIILYWFSKYKADLNKMLNDSAKELITNLQQLLKFLMGSPVGLKLNHAFNNALGNFFLYHIELWRTFLVVSSPLMDTAFFLVFIVASFGFSFQTALAADIRSLATFHVYCIYVYAARLYGVQVHGLLSLWRLFIGRKRNPLRDRVDSCQYSHHQLFVGTLAFTILLFLLPTTMLYYMVFTTLRLMLMVSDGFFCWLRNMILGLPLYVTFLWAINSPRTKGTVYVQASEQMHNTTLTLNVTLKTNAWWCCVLETKPPRYKCLTHPSVSFSILLHSIAIGDLL